jgi:hypothetical protein
MQDTVDMRAVERIPSLEQRNIFSWSRFLSESVLAIGGALVVTGLISLFRLYPQIPNISLGRRTNRSPYPQTSLLL